MAAAVAEGDPRIVGDRARDGGTDPGGGRWRWLGRGTGLPDDPFPAGLACTHGRRAGYVVADNRLLRVWCRPGWRKNS